MSKLYDNLNSRDKSSREEFKFYLVAIEIVFNNSFLLLKPIANIIITYSIVELHFFSAYQRFARKLNKDIKLSYHNDYNNYDYNYVPRYLKKDYSFLNGKIIDNDITDKQFIKKIADKKEFYDILDMILAKISFEKTREFS